MSCELSGFHLQDVLLIVGLQGRTGELVLESGNNLGSIFFHEGRILQAFSPYSRAIGDLLVEDGVMTETELLDVLKTQKNGPQIVPIGSLLMKTGKVGFEVIEMMVQEQIRSAVGEFITWSGLDYAFITKDIKPYDTICLPIHEFVQQETLKSATVFLTDLLSSIRRSPSHSVPPPAVQP